jgi:hypothetical protein
VFRLLNKLTTFMGTLVKFLNYYRIYCSISHANILINITSNTLAPYNTVLAMLEILQYYNRTIALMKGIEVGSDTQFTNKGVLMDNIHVEPRKVCLVKE